MSVEKTHHIYNVKSYFSSESKLVDNFTVCFEKNTVMGSMGCWGRLTVNGMESVEGNPWFLSQLGKWSCLSGGSSTQQLKP